MGQGMSYWCTCCGVRIEDDHSPFLVYTVTGPSRLHPDTRAGANGGEYALSPSTRALLAELEHRAEARREWCSTCYAWERGEDLVSGPAEAPVVVVRHADHATRDTFHAAAKTFHAEQAVKRAERAAAKAAQAAAEAKAKQLAAQQAKALPNPEAAP